MESLVSQHKNEAMALYQRISSRSIDNVSARHPKVEPDSPQFMAMVQMENVSLAADLVKVSETVLRATVVDMVENNTAQHLGYADFRDIIDTVLDGASPALRSQARAVGELAEMMLEMGMEARISELINEGHDAINSKIRAAVPAVRKVQKDPSLSFDERKGKIEKILDDAKTMTYAQMVNQSVGREPGLGNILYTEDEAVKIQITCSSDLVALVKHRLQGLIDFEE